MDFTGLALATFGGLTSLASAMAGLATVVYRGNRKARAEIEKLSGRLTMANGLITRMYLVLVSHGWMSDPDLIHAAQDVVRAAERGENA